MLGILTNSVNMVVVVLTMFAVFLAMTIDLIAGVFKAKQQGEEIQSNILKRSLGKFITYHGGLAIATLVDILIQLSNIFVILKLGALVKVPIVLISVGVFLLTVEFISVREKADQKTRRRQDKTLKLLTELLKNDGVKSFLARQIKGENTNNASKEEYINEDGKQEF